MKIYLSSTFEDLRSERQELRAALTDADYTVLSMEDYQSSDRPPLDKCFHDIEGSDLYLGVVSWRYGDVPKPEVLAGLPLPKGTQLDRRSLFETPPLRLGLG
jgi:hypothetical protein